ncbi:MAG: DNA methyltransferase, partial [Actinobacteria bacterium]|nr:DNA methyltransferase [Actinomycetota bacterium]
RAVNVKELDDAIRHLSSLQGQTGYFTETFCIKSRFFQPKNGAKVDAIREVIESDYKNSTLYPILLTSLILAADRVDSTTGIQMAYVKSWSERSFNDLELRIPELLPGSGAAIQGDALSLTESLGEFDLAYLDPPYNQHRYFSNYHIWETLVAWDKPDYYGIACKRIDTRADSTKSRFNEKANMANSLRKVIQEIKASTIVISYNDESWVTSDELMEMCSHFEDARLLAFDSKRYVGAQIGIFNPKGKKVGAISHLRNQEWVLVAGNRNLVSEITEEEIGAYIAR